MSRFDRAPAHQGPVLRVAAVWGTQVLAVRHLKPGQPLTLGDEPEALMVKPEGSAIVDRPLRAVGGSWELDARGASGGTVRLRGRDENPVELGRGSAVPLVVGDYGLVQYGQLALFFQFTTPVRLAVRRPKLDFSLVLSFLVAALSVGGTLLTLKQLTPEETLPKPLELTSAGELTRRLRLPEEPTPPAPTPTASAGGERAKEGGGGKPLPGAAGKLGKQGQASTTKIPGERPGLGGMSEVLSGSVGDEVRATLGSLSSVAAALGGLRSDRVLLGVGSGTGLRGAGAGGGGDSPGGVPYGAGSLDTGLGAGSGAGSGSGGRGRGLGSGNGSGNGSGSGTGEHQMGAAKAAAPGQGLSQAAIDRVVRSRYGAFRACYESAAAQDPNLSGTVSVAIRIAPSGSVQSASIAGSSLNSARVEGCLLRQFKRLAFPAADKGTASSVPLAFKPSKR